MSNSARRLRAGALAAVAALALTGLAASPAVAAEPPAPVISLDRTSFPAGDWADGFTVTGSGFDPSVPTANVVLGAGGENGGGIVYEEEVAVSAAGEIDAVIVPDQPSQAPDAAGYPVYGVSVSQVIGEDWIFSNNVTLTITPGTSLTLAGELTVAEVEGGFTAQFAGFGANEPIEYSFRVARWTEAEGDQTLTILDEATVADAGGAGTITAAFAGLGVQAGDYVELWIVGADTGRQARSFSTVVATPAPAPAPAPAEPAAAAPAAAPRLPDTGIELGAGVGALMLMLLGAGAIVVTRRARVAQR